MNIETKVCIVLVPSRHFCLKFHHSWPNFSPLARPLHLSSLRLRRCIKEFTSTSESVVTNLGFSKRFQHELLSFAFLLNSVVKLLETGLQIAQHHAVGNATVDLMMIFHGAHKINIWKLHILRYFFTADSSTYQTKLQR